MPLCVFEMRCVLLISDIGLVELRWILMKVGYALQGVFGKNLCIFTEYAVFAWGMFYYDPIC